MTESSSQEPVEVKAEDINDILDEALFELLTPERPKNISCEEEEEEEKVGISSDNVETSRSVPISPFPPFPLTKAKYSDLNLNHQHQDTTRDNNKNNNNIGELLFIQQQRQQPKEGRGSGDTGGGPTLRAVSRVQSLLLEKESSSSTGSSSSSTPTNDDKMETFHDNKKWHPAQSSPSSIFKMKHLPKTRTCFFSLVFLWMFQLIVLMKASFQVAFKPLEMNTATVQQQQRDRTLKTVEKSLQGGDDGKIMLTPEVVVVSRSNNFSSSSSSLAPPAFLRPFSSTIQRSDFVELDHCDLSTLNWTQFHSWAIPIIEEKQPSQRTILEEEKKNYHFQKMRKMMMMMNSTTSSSDGNPADFLKDEYLMELLEMYATHSGLCNFENYRPAIKGSKTSSMILEAGLHLQRVVQTVKVPPGQVRIVFSIVAYRDSKHLRHLIEAIHLPQHLIIIHLERQQQNGNEYIHQVQAIAADYDNVVVVKFGTIIYKTDSISRINLQLMHWVVNDLELEFDYYATLGGAVFPLFGATELSQYLHNSKGNVWLGEATMKGRRVHVSQSYLLWKKRLHTTSSKLSVRAGFLFNDTVPDWLDDVMKHKSNSGDQAMFSHSVIRRMLNNRHVLQLFAMAKYACCCCVEERTWIAAMDLLGHLQEAKARTNMYQLWGGERNRCVGSMNNAILDMNDTRCFRDESLSLDPVDGTTTTTTNNNNNNNNIYIWGNSTWASLIRAKERGTLFARKFDSNHTGSVELLEKIKNEMHAKLDLVKLIIF